MVGHLKILEELQDIQMPEEISDYMPRKLNFEHPFEVIIPDRNEWESCNPKHEKNAMIWYTDGSKSEKGVGIGIHGPKYGLSKALGTTPTVFQAEIHAIETCAAEGTKRGLTSAKVFILSDSQAALKALCSNTCESRLTWECLNTIKGLAHKNTVTLMWVPGHEGIEGNEIADKLAKQGAQSSFIGPEPFCGLSNGVLRKRFKEWEDKEKSLYWRNTTGQKQAKKFITHSEYKLVPRTK